MLVAAHSTDPKRGGLGNQRQKKGCGTRFKELVEVVNRKHFEEGATLNNRKMLSEAAAEAGLDRIAALEYLASDEDLQAVRDEAEHSRMMMQKVGAGCAIPYAIVGDQKSSRVQGA